METPSGFGLQEIGASSASVCRRGWSAGDVEPSGQEKPAENEGRTTYHFLKNAHHIYAPKATQERMHTMVFFQRDGMRAYPVFGSRGPTR